MYAVYVSPNIPLNMYKLRTDKIFSEAERHPRTSIKAGDKNTRSPLWKSSREHERGEHVES